MSTVALTSVTLVLPGTNLGPNNFYYNQTLVGVVDGVNKSFKLPNSLKYVHNLGITAQVMVNNVKQLSGITKVESAGLGTGFDTVTFTTAPSIGSTITADWVTPT